MPLSKKRKITPPVEDDSDGQQGAVVAETPLEVQLEPQQGEGIDHSSDEPVESSAEATGNPSSRSTSETTKPQDTKNDRLARFAALRARATDSARSNLAEAKAEAKRSAIDPTVLANLSRRAANASHNLMKADTEAEGGNGAFERKRAWDYTIEESEKWDERMERKKAARDNNVFQDYSAEAGKIYDRQVRVMEKNALKNGGKNREEYEKQKAELLENAARSGGLEIVEMENGELVAIDKEGRFYADHDSTGFVEQKPRKENVDRLVDDLKKAEEVRIRKNKARKGDVDEGDVTYINDRNKQFNQKLARFYDRYTTDIRESFERGTAI